MKDLLELIKFVQSQTKNIDEQAEMLAAFGTPPELDSVKPVQKLPVENELPAFNLRQPGVGSDLVGLNYGVPAPVFGQSGFQEPSIGELLIGDIDG